VATLCGCADDINAESQLRKTFSRTSDTGPETLVGVPRRRYTLKSDVLGRAFGTRAFAPPRAVMKHRACNIRIITQIRVLHT
jgi:hypothetical protein